MCSVTAIQFMDGKCHIKKQKSRKTALSSYYVCLSRDLLLMPSGHRHTHTHTHARTHIYTPMFVGEIISRKQACRPDIKTNEAANDVIIMH